MVTSDTITASASVTLNAAQLLAALLFAEVPQQINQLQTGQPLIFQVSVSAMGPLGEAINPVGQRLMVTTLTNAVADENSYLLNFVDGIAQTTVTVELVRQNVDGRLRLSVIGGGINISTTVVLVAEVFAALELQAPTRLLQPQTGSALTVTVTVIARGSQGSAYNPEALRLLVTGENIQPADQSSYALTFVDGIAATTLTLNLLAQNVDGSIRLSVIGGGISISTTVVLVAEVFAALELQAPTRLLQPQTGSAVTVTVTVIARGSRGSAYNPEALRLQVTGENIQPADQSSYALTFVDGMAVTTLTPGLLVQEIDGSLRFEVQSGDIAAVATVTLVAVVLDSLTIEVPTAVEQQELDSTLTVVVTVRGCQFSRQSLQSGGTGPAGHRCQYTAFNPEQLRFDFRRRECSDHPDSGTARTGNRWQSPV